MATEASGGAVKKRQKKGKIVQEVTKVSEATRINVSKILEEFRKSDDEGNLNPDEKKNSCIDLLREREIMCFRVNLLFFTYCLVLIWLNAMLNLIDI